MSEDLDEARPVHGETVVKRRMRIIKLKGKNKYAPAGPGLPPAHRRNIPGLSQHVHDQQFVIDSLTYLFVIAGKSAVVKITLGLFLTHAGVFALQTKRSCLLHELIGRLIRAATLKAFNAPAFRGSGY